MLYYVKVDCTMQLLLFSLILRYNILIIFYYQLYANEIFLMLIKGNRFRLYYNIMEAIKYVGIRREDKSVWQRRTPLVPADIKQIINQHPNIKFIVQPSKVRIYSDKQYQTAGAILDEDLTRCSLILGVKEIPAKAIIPNTTYLIFPHVIKAQPQNMPMLDAFLKKNARLIDYEKITDKNKNRLIAFGEYAGIAGAIDYLAGFGHYLLKAGFSTPFLNVSYSYKYFNLDDAYVILRRVGEKIIEQGIPKELQPMIFAVTGTGRTATGVLKVLNCLPVKVVSPEELPNLVNDKNNPQHSKVIYLSNIKTEDVTIPRDPDAKFNKADFYAHPEKYKNIFKKKFLPYITSLFHCIYWEKKYPRYLKGKHITKLNEADSLRLMGICDVTCDFEGSIQFLKTFTTPDRPFFFYDSQNNSQTVEFDYKKGKVMYLAVDFLPCQLAYDASNHFSHILKKWVYNIVNSDPSKPIQKQGLLPELQCAVITSNGQLTPDFQYIDILRAEQTQSLRYTDSMMKELMGQPTGGEIGPTHSLQPNNIATDIKLKELKRKQLNFEEDQ